MQCSHRITVFLHFYRQIYDEKKKKINFFFQTKKKKMNDYNRKREKLNSYISLTN